jgi:hypothetical protein
MRNRFLRLAALVAASLGVTGAATAGQTPGSLLVFPEFNNHAGVQNLLTITNTSATDSVTVEIIYIDGDDCSEVNRHVELTPRDTFTFLTKYHNPQMARGYAYAFAKESVTGAPISFNHLVGGSVSLFGKLNLGGAGGVGANDTQLAATNPWVFQAPGAEGSSTELNGDGLRNLDGNEYTRAPDRIVIPRFLGQDGNVESTLYLIGLTGGARFTTTVDFLIHNDNEEVFSSEYSFDCWAAVRLSDISGIFNSSYLQAFTNQDPNEVFGTPRTEAGWILLDGAVASSASTTYADPAILAFLGETLAGQANAQLPFCQGEQANGSLLARSLDGTF